MFYSQHGEDRWIVENLKLPTIGTFIDVGASDGHFLSNSKAFEEMGWNGLLIEPDPRRVIVNRKAPVLKCAVGPVAGTFDFPLSAIPDWSGFRRQGCPTAKIEVKRLDAILQEQRIDKIDILSIDTEGTELEVWSSLNNRVRPTIVIVEWETRGLPDQSGAIMDCFYSANYRLKHTTAGNFIFQDCGA